MKDLFTFENIKAIPEARCKQICKEAFRCDAERDIELQYELDFVLCMMKVGDGLIAVSVRDSNEVRATHTDSSGGASGARVPLSFYSSLMEEILASQARPAKPVEERDIDQLFQIISGLALILTNMAEANVHQNKWLREQFEELKKAKAQP